MTATTVAHTHSATCSTCEDLSRLHARNRVALYRAQKLYLAALRAAGPVPLADLEEELKQTTAAAKIIDYTVQVHQSRHHAASAARLAIQGIQPRA